jgi:hypothetical protein
MKHVTLLGLALLLAGGMQGQVVFESGFEDWNGALPTDWYGSKSNLAQSGVAQVTDNVHGDDYAVRLTKSGTGHQRFTTQPVSVTADQAYEVRFWVRGEGQIRVGLYDGRATTSGYAPYSAWNSITGNTWTEIAVNVTAVMDAANAEFILSVQSTVAPENLVVDDVTITEVTIAPPPVVTIQDIQTSSAPDGASPLANQVVTTSGIVTAITTTPSNGYFIQNGPGAWSGIFVFNAPGTLAIGDAVTLTATVAEYNGQTQLGSIQNQSVTSTGNAMPNTPITTADAQTEPYESVLATVTNAACTEAPSGANFGKWKADDGSGWIYIGKQMYTTTPSPTVGQVYRVTGICLYSFGEFNLSPRQTSDVELITGTGDLAQAAVRIYPNPATDVLRIETGSITGRIEYALTDAAGRTVLSGLLNGQPIALDGLQDGAYALALRSAGSVRYATVMVRR